MTARRAKPPTRAGVHWVALDDGERVTDVVLVEVMTHPYKTDLAEGAYLRFLDGSDRRGQLDDMAQRLFYPNGTGSLLGFATTRQLPETRLTWLGEVRPGKALPKVGDKIGEDGP